MAPTTTPNSLHSTTTPSRTPQSKHRLHFNSAKGTHPSPNPALKETALAEHPAVYAITLTRKKSPFQPRTYLLTGVVLGSELKLGIGILALTPGIVYRALKDILGDENEMDGVHIGLGSFVQVSVLEIYNEEIYDLLSNNSGGGLGLGWPKGNASKVGLEVMGKKAKNAIFLSGMKLIILDVPTVGGRLMLVDMAGSENIEQAGQVGFEAKKNAAKINQGNIALKRVVESIFSCSIQR
ncbi:hypothetical protein IFM89_007563 [Coptis chinensis]|uniref:Kinesin motor domain-containing protein n=1 Tax=Coptis chinensis TaxID=261450 RepID=A0A835I168_9MAGN|nr:hypothetical protein IFM89_007563 [Coptis chinensis]